MQIVPIDTSFAMMIGLSHLQLEAVLLTVSVMLTSSRHLIVVKTMLIEDMVLIFFFGAV